MHIWAGFYDNAFDIVRRLYARLGRDPQAWKSCFAPLNHFTVTETDGATWKPWLLQFPSNDLEPGLGARPAAVPPLSLLVQFLVTLEGAFRRSDLPTFLDFEARRRARARVAAIVPSPPPPADDETVLTLTRQAAEKGFPSIRRK